MLLSFSLPPIHWRFSLHPVLVGIDGVDALRAGLGPHAHARVQSWRASQSRQNPHDRASSVKKISVEPLTFDSDFDFESSNAQFDKEDIEKELKLKLTISTCGWVGVCPELLYLWLLLLLRHSGRCCNGGTGTGRPPHPCCDPHVMWRSDRTMHC